MKYINAATATEIISDKLNIPLSDLCDIVAEIPSEDVQPVKHGKWIIDYAEGGEIYHAHCSECNNEPDRNIGGDYYIDKLSSRKR